MKFKDVLKQVIKGLTSYYDTCSTKVDDPNYDIFLKMGDCKNLEDLIDSMEAQGFGAKDNEPLAWWILVFLIEDPEGDEEEWTDPAGGVHCGTEDPAKMYE